VLSGSNARMVHAVNEAVAAEIATSMSG